MSEVNKQNTQTKQNQDDDAQQTQQTNQAQQTEQVEQTNQTSQTEQTNQTSRTDKDKPLNSINEAMDELSDEEVDPKNTKAEDEKVIDLDGERKVSLSELKEGFQKGEEYETKIEELNQQKESVDGLRDNYNKDAALLKNTYTQLAQFLEGLIPAEPDFELAQSNPSEYQYQMALRNNAIAELTKVYNAAQSVNGQVAEVSKNQIEQYKANEHQKLVKAMPALQDKNQNVAFHDAIKKIATGFGFTPNEINATADHRILQLVHYAGLGKQAEQNQKNARARTAEKPLNGNPPRPATATTSPNKDAMKRLIQTGSIEAAMAVDFE